MVYLTLKDYKPGLILLNEMHEVVNDMQRVGMCRITGQLTANPYRQKRQKHYLDKQMQKRYNDLAEELHTRTRIPLCMLPFLSSKVSRGCLGWPSDTPAYLPITIFNQEQRETVRASEHPY